MFFGGQAGRRRFQGCLCSIVHPLPANEMKRVFVSHKVRAFFFFVHSWEEKGEMGELVGVILTDGGINEDSKK